MVSPVYGSFRVPLSTTQPLVPALIVSLVRSRRRTSLRWSQPLWSASVQAGPNSSRSYPVPAARPLTVIFSSAASALPLGPFAGFASGPESFDEPLEPLDASLVRP